MVSPTRLGHFRTSSPGTTYCDSLLLDLLAGGPHGRPPPKPASQHASPTRQERPPSALKGLLSNETSYPKPNFKPSTLRPSQYSNVHCNLSRRRTQTSGQSNSKTRALKTSHTSTSKRTLYCKRKCVFDTKQFLKVASVSRSSKGKDVWSDRAQRHRSLRQFRRRRSLEAEILTDAELLRQWLAC